MTKPTLAKKGARYFHARVRASDGKLMLECTNDAFIIENLVGPGRWSPRIYASPRLSRESKQAGIIAVLVDEHGGIAGRHD